MATSTTRQGNSAHANAEVTARLAELQSYVGHLETVLDSRTKEIRTLVQLNLFLTAILTALVLGIIARAIGI